MRNKPDLDSELTTSDDHNNGPMHLLDDEESSDDENDTELIYDNWSIDFDVDMNPSEQHLLVNHLLKKCRAISNVLKQSLILSEYFRKEKESIRCDRNIRIDCKSRWNSTYILINSFIDLKHSIIKVFSNKKGFKLRQDQTQKLSNIELNMNDWELLSSLNDILEPFAVATELISGKNYPTIGLCYCAVNKLKSSFTKNDNPDEQTKRMRKLLFDKFKKYFHDDDEQLQTMQVRN